MIGQHRPLSQSAENHLSRGHGCSKVQQSRPTSRAPKKLIAAPLPPIDPAPEHDDADPPLAPRRTTRPTLALLVANRMSIITGGFWQRSLTGRLSLWRGSWMVALGSP